MSRKNMERLLATASACILLVSWIAGDARTADVVLERIRNISGDIVEIRGVRPSVYEGFRKDRPSEKLFIAMAEHPSYGGPLQVAVVMNEQEQIERVALVRSTDTSTYLGRVLNEGVLDAFLGRQGSKLPEVDAVSGATLSSTAMVMGMKKAIAHIRNIQLADEQTSSLPMREVLKTSVTALFFLAVLFISSSYYKGNRKYARLGLLAVSTLIMGFTFGMQFSLSSLVLLLSGLWTKGMASYAALAGLVCAVSVFFMTRKNLYCASICPFGGVQEGLSRITECSAPKRSEWMKWTSRMFTLAAMCISLYLSNPADALYEPFGMAFSFIGSTFLFALTIAIAIASLFIKRPWCNLLCPIACVFDYLAFMRAWLTSGAVKGQDEV